MVYYRKRIATVVVRGFARVARKEALYRCWQLRVVFIIEEYVLPELIGRRHLRYRSAIIDVPRIDINQYN